MTKVDVQHVVAAVVVNAAAQVLVARRPLDRHQGGLWEFPGGKVEAGEEPRATLAREFWHNGPENPSKKSRDY